MAFLFRPQIPPHNTVCAGFGANLSRNFGNTSGVLLLLLLLGCGGKMHKTIDDLVGLWTSMSIRYMYGAQSVKSSYMLY